MTTQVLSNGVIVAENDEQIRDLIRSVLLRARQQVFPVANGAEALMMARRLRARLVLLDISMPRLNGLQACTAIRNLPGYADVPIVMLTAHDDERFRATAKRVGATNFIAKPFRPSLLLTQLAEYLDYPESTNISGVLLPTGPQTILVRVGE
jgi:sigma-B regulation protein RsbU (phosphoserine phosphatase)